MGNARPFSFTARILPLCYQNRNHEWKHSIREIRQKLGFAYLVLHVCVFFLASSALAHPQKRCRILDF